MYSMGNKMHIEEKSIEGEGSERRNQKTKK